MTKPGSRTLAYRPELDGVRAIAVLAVLGFHISFTVVGMRHVFSGGFLGVDVFFVLSGMLITELLVTEHLKRGAVSLRGFYYRRARRLIPALVVLLVVVTIYHQVAHGTGRATLQGVLSIVAYTTTGHFAGKLSPGVGQIWTLAVEWEFYLIWPAVLVFLLSRKVALQRVGIGALVAAIALSIGRALAFHFKGNDIDVGYYLAWFRFDELLLGCACGLLGSRPQAPSWLRPLALIGVIVIITRAHFVSSWVYLGGMLLLAILTVIVVQPRERPSVVDKVLSLAPLVWTGKLSYSLYLWSVPVVAELRHHVAGWPSGWQVVVYVATSYAFATASYYLVERRFRLTSPRNRLD